MDDDLRRLADAAESLEREARELRTEIERLADATRAKTEAESARAEAERSRPQPAPEPTEPAADDSEARLVAYSMVLDGKPREEVAAHLQRELGVSDSTGLLDDLYARAGA